MNIRVKYLWSIIINIIGIILGLFAAKFINFGRFLPMYKDIKFNFSIFLLILFLFWLCSLIFYIIGRAANLNLKTAATVEEYQINYDYKKSLRKFDLLSLFLILYIISFIFWMLLYDNNTEYCYFLCSIYDVVIISLIVPLLFSITVILLIKVFKKKKEFFLK